MVQCVKVDGLSSAIPGCFFSLPVTGASIQTQAVDGKGEHGITFLHHTPSGLLKTSLEQTMQMTQGHTYRYRKMDVYKQKKKEKYEKSMGKEMP